MGSFLGSCGRGGWSLGPPNSKRPKLFLRVQVVLFCGFSSCSVDFGTKTPESPIARRTWTLRSPNQNHRRSSRALEASQSHQLHINFTSTPQSSVTTYMEVSTKNDPILHLKPNRQDPKYKDSCSGAPTFRNLHLVPYESPP